MLNPHEKGIDLLPLIKYADIVAYLCFQGEPSGFENKDNFYKELKEEERSNRAPGEPTEAKETMHNRAWGRHDRAAGPERWHGYATNRTWTHDHMHGHAGVRDL